MGPEQKKSDPKPPGRAAEGLIGNSFFRGPQNRAFRGSIQGVTPPSRIKPDSPSDRRIRIESRQIAGYSAAKTNEGFTFAADIMKSEMRGTISDLKREPLKTP